MQSMESCCSPILYPHPLCIKGKTIRAVNDQIKNGVSINDLVVNAKLAKGISFIQDDSNNDKFDVNSLTT